MNECANEEFLIFSLQLVDLTTIIPQHIIYHRKCLTSDDVFRNMAFKYVVVSLVNPQYSMPYNDFVTTGKTHYSQKYVSMS